MSYLSWFRRGVLFWICAFAIVSPAFGQKKWTLLVYLNGHNNLDKWGAVNINQMEKLGSNADIDMVVQYASSAASTTKRYHIQKDSSSSVTSPVVEDLPRVDMGVGSSLVEFVKWGMAKYPADHYFVDIWNHGNGWKRNLDQEIRSISSDDFSGHKISTVQLGAALKEISDHLGRKIDVVGADACLMGMGEILSELENSTEYFVGSEEVEPAEGWPYDKWMGEWMKNPSATTPEMLSILVKEYVKSYTSVGMGSRTVTLSAYDLAKLPAFYDSVNDLGDALQANTNRTFFADALKKTTAFYDSEYLDFGNLVHNLRQVAGRATAIEAPLNLLDNAIKEIVVAHDSNGKFKGVTKGLAIWAPKYKSSVNSLASRYEELNFAKVTNWLETLRTLVP